MNTALGYERQLPYRIKHKIGVVLAACAGLEFIKDGTKRPVRRPKDKTRQEIPFQPGSKLWQDAGFQGYQPEHTTIYQPTKKPKGK